MHKFLIALFLTVIALPVMGQVVPHSFPANLHPAVPPNKALSPNVVPKQLLTKPVVLVPKKKPNIFKRFFHKLGHPFGS